jgi:uncharacterized protein
VSGASASQSQPWRSAAVGALALALAACGITGSPPVTYVLGLPATGAEQVEPLTRRPVIELKPVLVPDYLDVSDILVRRAENVMAPSPTGRWGERLSVGIMRALAAGLVRRLPGYDVTATAPVEQPARQIVVDVETFESRTGGSVVLVAKWRALDGAGRSTLAGERVSLVQPIAGVGDAAIVAAMTHAVEDFAERVADGIRHTARGSQVSR